jgi:hypothetical protein
LRAGLGKATLVLRGIRHRDGCAVDELDTPALPEPILRDMSLQAFDRPTEEAADDAKRELLARLARRVGLGVARGFAVRDEVSEESVHGVAAGMVLAEDLGEERPERDPGGEDRSRKTTCSWVRAFGTTSPSRMSQKGSPLESRRSGIWSRTRRRICWDIGGLLATRAWTM